MPFRVLIVDQTDASRSEIERLLTEAGHYVTRVAGFQEAKQRLMLVQPDILVTGLRLGAYNGIQLALRVNADGAGIPAIVLDDTRDPVLEREAISAGAVYLTLPLDDPSFVTLVDQLLAASRAKQLPAVSRRWPRKHAGITIDVSGDDAKVVDVSYGGLRLELPGAPDETLPRIGTVDVPHVGTMAVHPIWARGEIGVSGRWWCGAEVDAINEATGVAWRRLVDSLA